MPDIKLELTDRQSEAYLLLTSMEDLALMYGGGKGGGKSLLFCVWVTQWCEFLIKYFKLKPNPKAPIPVGFIGRKQAIDFRRTTLETYKRIVPPSKYRIKEQDQEIIIGETVKMHYGGLDDRATVNKFNSAEYAFFAIDQAEETERTEIDVLQGSLRLKINGMQPPYKQLYTANPAECWLKNDFLDNPLPSYHFIPALYKDNRHLPTNYADTLFKAFRYNKALLEAYRDGNWHALKASNMLVSSQELEALKGIVHHFKYLRGIVACDPSLGGDECVIYVLKNYRIVEEKIMHERDPMKIAGHMRVLGVKHAIPNYAADTTGGLGEAILARVRELKNESSEQEGKCISVNSSDAAEKPEAYANVKMEMSWHFMTLVIDKALPYIEDEETRRQVLALRFKVINSQGKTIMLVKDEIKKVLGCSPDRADCYILGCYAQDKTEPIRVKDAWRDGNHRSAISGGADSAMTA